MRRKTKAANLLENLNNQSMMNQGFNVIGISNPRSAYSKLNQEYFKDLVEQEQFIFDKDDSSLDQVSENSSNGIEMTI